mgnify:FL=1
MNKKVSTIAYEGFNDCKYLKNIEIPNTVTTIKESSFCGCTSLKKIVIPKSVKSIGRLMIADNKHVPEIEFEDIDGWQRRYVHIKDGEPYTDWENIDPTVVADSKKMRDMFSENKIITSGAYMSVYYYEFQKV